jgi:hypothetical protein
MIHADSEAEADAAEAKVRAAYRIGDAPELAAPVLRFID